MKEAKKRQKEYADRGSKDDNFQVGDPVYLRNHRRTNKLYVKWSPFYRITKKTGDLSFHVRSHFDGTETKTHARHLRHANIDEWKVPSDKEGQLLRRTTYVVPREKSDEESTNETPFEKVVKYNQQEREDSDSEDDIPIAKKRRRLQSRNSKPEINYESDNEASDPEINQWPKTENDQPNPAFDNADSNSFEDMDVDLVAKTETGSLDSSEASQKQDKAPTDSKTAVKNLLASIQALI